MRLLKHRIPVKSKSQKVEVFIRDIENKGDSAVQTSVNIKSDKTINIPLKIKKEVTLGTP